MPRAREKGITTVSVKPTTRTRLHIYKSRVIVQETLPDFTIDDAINRLLDLANEPKVKEDDSS